MDKKVLSGIIGEKLDTIQEQFAIIKEYEGKIPTIEIDLLMANIRDLYELFMTLQQENLGIPSPPPVAPAEHHSEPVVPPASPVPPPPAVSFEPEYVVEPVAEAPVIEVPAEEPAEIHDEPPVPRRSPTILSFEPVTAPEATEEPVMATQPEMELPSPPKAEQPEEAHTSSHEERHPRITFDLFSEGGASTLADRLRDAQDKRLADRLQENKMVDLRSTIGINDKFLFINELFDGNMRIYDEAVQKLSDSATMAQADLFLLDLKIVYNWDSDSPTVKKFVELVRRKF